MHIPNTLSFLVEFSFAELFVIKPFFNDATPEKQERGTCIVGILSMLDTTFACLKWGHDGHCFFCWIILPEYILSCFLLLYLPVLGLNIIFIGFLLTKNFNPAHFFNYCNLLSRTIYNLENYSRFVKRTAPREFFSGFCFGIIKK